MAGEEVRQTLPDGEAVRRAAGLWKRLPLPEGEPEPAPEYALDTFSFPGSRVIAARVRGKKHKHEGVNCDDWYEAASAGGSTCLVVADGAGSKKFSRIGAREACRAASASLTEGLERDFSGSPKLWEHARLPLTDSRCAAAWGVLAGIVQKSVMQAAEAVEAAYAARSGSPEYASLLGRELRLEDFSSTLLAAVLIPVGGGECLAAACQIGDGAIALLDTKTGPVPAVKLLGEADRGDFSGETEFLTSPRMRRLEALQSRTRITRCAADTVFVMTDGVSDDYFPPAQGMPSLYRDLKEQGILDAGAAEASRLLRQWLDSYAARGSFDDRTLAVAQLR